MTEITYIRTLEGFTYLVVVIDLYSRRVVGWSMQSRQTTDVVLEALHMAVWRRKPKQRVLIHSDQGSQFTSMDWAAFIRAHDLEHSMGRRGNCHDNKGSTWRLPCSEYEMDSRSVSIVGIVRSPHSLPEPGSAILRCCSASTAAGVTFAIAC